MSVADAIKILQTMPQEAQLMISHENCGCCYGPMSAVSIHTEDRPSKHRDVHLTVVVIEDDVPHQSLC